MNWRPDGVKGPEGGAEEGPRGLQVIVGAEEELEGLVVVGTAGVLRRHPRVLRLQRGRKDDIGNILRVDGRRRDPPAAVRGERRRGGLRGRARLRRRWRRGRGLRAGRRRRGTGGALQAGPRGLEAARARVG